MKKGKFGTSALCSLLGLMLAGIVITLGATAHAASMAGFATLPALDSQVDKPFAIAADGQGRIYVAESLSNRVLIFTQSGSLLATLSGLDKPISVAVDDQGRIYVGNALKGNVTVFASNRNPLFKLGNGDGEFGKPVDIDIDAGGQVYVTDKDNNAVRVYSASGQLIQNIGAPGNGDGQLQHPTSLAIDPISSELVILDRQQIRDNYAGTMIEGARIQYFNLAGTFLRGYAKFGYNMAAGQLVKPQQVTVDRAGRVYVTDARLQKVMVYDHANTFLGMIDNSAAPLRTPLGLCMSANNRLYVSTLLSGRVDVFGIDNYSAMDVQPASLSFTATEGDDLPAPQAATIMNSGKAELAWTVSTTAGWLSLPTPGGALAPAASGAITVGVQHDGLAPGTYQGSVKVTAPGMEELVAVSLTVKPSPLQVSPAGLTFTATAGTTPAAQVLNVVTGASELVNWSASADQGWLFLNKTAGSGSDSLKVYANTSGLSAGSYAGTITFVNLTGGKNVSVAVNLSLSESSEPPTEPPGLPLPGGGSVKAGGKNWRVSQPAAGVALHGVWGLDHRDVLAVGDGGTILNFDGKNWRTMSSGTEATLRNIRGSVTARSYDAYTVGDGGVALRFDGTAWSRINTGTTDPLADIWVATEVLALGSYGKILNLTKSTSSNENIALRSIWGSSATDVFVVGESGTIIHYDGTAWTAMVSDTNQWLNAVWGSSENDVFVVGENGTIIHYDGTAWTTMESGVYETLHAVYGDAPDNVYAVGDNGAVLRYDGTGWNVLLAGGISLRGIWAGDGLVVAVGDDGTILTGRGGNIRKGPGKKPKATLLGGQQDQNQGGKVGTGEALLSPMLRGDETR